MKLHALWEKFFNLKLDGILEFSKSSIIRRRTASNEKVDIAIANLVGYSTDASGNVIGLASPINTGAIPLGAGYEYAGKSSLGASLLDFSTLTGFSVTGAGVTMQLVSASIPSIGKSGNSIKVTIPAGVSGAFRWPAWAAKYNPNQNFTLCYEKLNVEPIVTNTWYMTVEPAYSNYYTSSATPLFYYGLHLANRSDGAVVKDWSVGLGVPTYSTITEGKVNITAPAGSDTVIIFHGLWACSYSPPIIQITADDGALSQYTYLLPMLNKYGFKAGFGIIYNGGGAFTADMLSQIYRDGHDLIPHGNAGLSTYGSAGLAIADIQANANYLKNLGYVRGSNCYIYPLGEYNYSATDYTSIANYLASSGYKCAYIVGGAREFPYAGINSTITKRYSLNATVNTTTLADNLNTAITSGQGMTLMIHGVVASGATGGNCNIADLETVFDNLAVQVRAGKCVVLPPSQALLAQL